MPNSDKNLNLANLDKMVVFRCPPYIQNQPGGSLALKGGAYAHGTPNLRVRSGRVDDFSHGPGKSVFTYSSA